MIKASAIIVLLGGCALGSKQERVVVDMKSVVEYCTGKLSKIWCSGSAVMIADNVAITASHVMYSVGDEYNERSTHHHVKFSNGKVAEVKTIITPGFMPRRKSGRSLVEMPALLILKDEKAVPKRQEISATGWMIDQSASFIGKYTAIVAAETGLLNPIATLDLIDSELTPTNRLHYEALDFADSACRGDSGGGLFNSRNELIGVHIGQLDTHYVSVGAEFTLEEGRVGCNNGPLSFIRLSYYQEWIDDMLSRH